MGGATPSEQTQKTSQTSGPPAEIAPYLKDLTGKGWDWFQGNQTPPAWLPQSERLVGADNNLYNRSNAGFGYGLNDSSRRLAADTLAGKYLDPKSNPAYQGWLEASFRPQAEQFRDILAPGIDAKFSAAGRPGSGAHFDTTMRGMQDLERAQADAAAKSALGMYQGERANQFAAANLLPSFQAQDYQDLAMQQQAGQSHDAYRRQQQAYESTAQPNWYQQMAQRLQGMYPGGTTSGTGTMTGTPSTNPTADIMGTIMSIAGTAAKFAPMMSDERLKDVQARVGYTDDGIPLFLYNYKGSREPRIGPMAQDVAKVKPEAVAEHPSGYLAVNYSQLTPGGGLF
jgi:hypothetical protein